MTLDLCANGFLNCSQVIGEVISAATQETTGSLFLTFLFVVIIIMVFAMLFQIKLEYTMLIILPLLLALMSYFQEFIALGAVMLIYLSTLITKNFILK